MVLAHFSLCIWHQKRHIVEAWALISNFLSCATDTAFVEMEGVLGGGFNTCLFLEFYFITKLYILLKRVPPHAETR